MKRIKRSDFSKQNQPIILIRQQLYGLYIAQKRNGDTPWRYTFNNRDLIVNEDTYRATMVDSGRLLL